MVDGHNYACSCNEPGVLISQLLSPNFVWQHPLKSQLSASTMNAWEHALGSIYRRAFTCTEHVYVLLKIYITSYQDFHIYFVETSVILYRVSLCSIRYLELVVISCHCHLGFHLPHSV